MQLQIKEAIRFYDETHGMNKKHASAVTGVIGEDVAIAVFCHYLSSRGWEVTPLDEPCTQGTKKGKWLDKWLLVESNDDAWLYQAEVKNWSAHSIGGKHLALDATPEEFRILTQARWREEWDEVNKKFHKPQVNKVLLTMRPPMLYRKQRIEPIVIYWFAIHPTGAKEACFTMEAQGAFSRVSVFSISTYLRSLLAHTIDVDVPRVAERLAILEKLLRR